MEVGVGILVTTVSGIALLLFKVEIILVVGIAVDTNEEEEEDCFSTVIIALTNLFRKV